ncbi:LpxL/LpxP family acyltransferase [Glaciimonas immobilis]|uniref:Putative LPLAT superfamily acyltransferase n=1 Tax=Glaciimonas immobilis TaxID=728004 RepID=A0A840RKQ6_9BURK|nr:acyltransferase [Glaciimonas immobilis]KAF3998837.1 acyltransferase [Glaciimonas immobilis]MBB5198225.1 putative LPLAT superfamily acyltransferase [Glaciimonas immobilis]
MTARHPHWAQINENSFVLGMRLLFMVYRIGGRLPFRLALHPILAWYLVTNSRARQASKMYLARVRKVADIGNGSGRGGLPPSGWSGAFQHFGAFAESILDKMLLWGGLFKTQDVITTGQEVIRANLLAKRGGVLICAHLGNLELCRVLSRQRKELRITVLVHTKHAKAFNRLLAQLDPDSQLNLIQVTELTPVIVMILAEKVAQGEFVAIAGDRIPVSPHPRVALAPFLGASAPFPIGPYVLASVLQCPVYLLFALTIGGHSECHFESFRDAVILPRKNRERVLNELAVAYARRLEHYCLRAPLQWFNFFDFWNLSTYDDAPH